MMSNILGPIKIELNDYPYRYFFPHTFLEGEKQGPRNSLIQEITHRLRHGPFPIIIKGPAGIGKKFCVLEAWVRNFSHHQALYIHAALSPLPTAAELRNLPGIHLFSQVPSLARSPAAERVHWSQVPSLITLRNHDLAMSDKYPTLPLLLTNLEHSQEDTLAILSSFFRRRFPSLVLEPPVLEYLAASRPMDGMRELINLANLLSQQALAEGLLSPSLGWVQAFHGKYISDEHVRFGASLLRHPDFLFSMSAQQFQRTAKNLEPWLLRLTLNHYQGKKRAAARALHMPVTTMLSKLAKIGQ